MSEKPVGLFCDITRFGVKNISNQPTIQMFLFILIPYSPDLKVLSYRSAHPGKYLFAKSRSHDAFFLDSIYLLPSARCPCQEQCISGKYRLTFYLLISGRVRAMRKNSRQWKWQTIRIAIVHCLNMIKGYDKIAVMKSGKIEEMGSYDELMAQKDLLYELATSRK